MTTKSLGPQLPASDVRLKEDVRRVGTTAHDLPLYTFKYRGQSGTYEGVMAQDVLAVRPDAVVEAADGFYRVNYAKLGIEMRRLDGPSLLDLARTADGQEVTDTARSFGPVLPDDGSG